MPTVLMINGLGFFFYSNENNEPKHVHVIKGKGNGKIWLQPFIAIAYLHGFTNGEEKEIIQLVSTHYEQLKN